MEDEMSGACSLYGGEEKFVEYFVQETLGKGQLGRRWHRWRNNVKIDFK
jgi:hypothetical protein